jgi:YYY domain-containing protein
LAYNLILPTLFSFAGGAAFTVAYNLVLRGKRRISKSIGGLDPIRKVKSKVWNTSALGAGLFAAVFCILIGNLAEVPVMLNAWQKSSDTNITTGIGAADSAIQVIDGAADLLFSDRTAPIYTGDWFWTATRAISIEPGEVQPITEFPFFTFLYGDLHAHMIALPLTLMALAWAVSLAMMPGQEMDGEIDPSKRWQSVIYWLAGSLIIGSLWATNTWDFPTYSVIAFLSIAYFVLKKHRDVNISSIGKALILSLGFIALSLLLFLPFTANYGRPYSSFSLWQGSYTSIPSYFAVFGLFLFIAVVHVFREFRVWTRTWTTEYLAKWEPIAWLVIGLLFGSILLVAFMVFRGYTITPIALSLTIAAGLLSLRRGLSVEHRIPLVLISAAFFLTLLVEIIVLDGDIGRMNTVFKFYLQVWVMLSIAGGVAVVWINEALRFRPTIRRLWRLGMVLLLATAALYPILATKAKWDIRMSEEAPFTLDGMEFMKTTSYTDTAYDGSPQTIELRYDYDAIQWMQRNIIGSPVIAEAHSSNPYRSIGNRVAMYTGLPAIVGWDWHQRQQRALMPANLVYDRIDDVNTLYNTTDMDEALEILESYKVKYIYAGQLEWVYYHPQGLLKFEEMAREGLLEEVYRNGGVSIYEVLPSSEKLNS